jgi:hypothetical protein
MGGRSNTPSFSKSSQTAAERASRLLAFMGAPMLIPSVLTYSGIRFRVFRGKVKAGTHYY